MDTETLISGGVGTLLGTLIKAGYDWLRETKAMRSTEAQKALDALIEGNKNFQENLLKMVDAQERRYGELEKRYADLHLRADRCETDREEQAGEITTLKTQVETLERRLGITTT